MTPRYVAAPIARGSNRPAKHREAARGGPGLRLNIGAKIHRAGVNKRLSMDLRSGAIRGPKAHVLEQVLLEIYAGCDFNQLKRSVDRPEHRALGDEDRRTPLLAANGAL
jgi:hypothetical protein